MKLRALLVRNLVPYRRILGVVVVLQVVQTFASLTLPSLNSDLINNGVLTGDNGYIRRVGLIMLGFTLLQVVFAVAAIFFGARVAMRFGRDLRRDLVSRVNAFSTREVGQFGAPSLITRITNDVQQVQMLVVMTVTLMITAPLTIVIGIILATREDLGLSWVLLISMPAVAIGLGAVGDAITAASGMPSLRYAIITGLECPGQRLGVRIDQSRAAVEPLTAFRVVGPFRLQVV